MLYRQHLEVSTASFTCNSQRGAPWYKFLMLLPLMVVQCCQREKQYWRPSLELALNGPRWSDAGYLRWLIGNFGRYSLYMCRLNLRWLCDIVYGLEPLGSLSCSSKCHTRIKCVEFEITLLWQSCHLVGQVFQWTMWLVSSGNDNVLSPWGPSLLCGPQKKERKCW